MSLRSKKAAETSAWPSLRERIYPSVGDNFAPSPNVTPIDLKGIPFGSTEDGAITLRSADGKAAVALMPFGPTNWIRIFHEAGERPSDKPTMSYLIDSQEEIFRSVRSDFSGWAVLDGEDVAKEFGLFDDEAEGDKG